jgi:hypothetical protein
MSVYIKAGGEETEEFGHGARFLSVPRPVVSFEGSLRGDVAVTMCAVHMLVLYSIDDSLTEARGMVERGAGAVTEELNVETDRSRSPALTR